MNIRVDVPDNPGLCRIRIYHATWKFKVGQAVMFGDGEPWIVANKTITAMGRQLYAIYRKEDERPVRMVIGSVLRPATIEQTDEDRVHAWYSVARATHMYSAVT